MSNKLFSMLELIKEGFPSNGFYALDLDGVTDIDGFFKDGLRNFHARVKCRTVCIRTAVSGGAEAKLFLASNIDAGDDGLILSVMHKAVDSLKSRFDLNDCFVIIHEWIPEDEYVYSANIMPLGDEFIVEAVKGNHAIMDRANIPPCIMKLGGSGVHILKDGLEPHELLEINRMVKALINSYVLRDKNVYELSFIRKGVTFYQIKKPGELVRHPLKKTDFYAKLRDRHVPFEQKILRKGNMYSVSEDNNLTINDFLNEDSKRDF